MTASFTVEGPPIKQKVRPLSPALQEELDIQIKSLLEHGIIRPSKSPWGAPPVFVRKKTGEYRMCLDYRKLNKRMKADAYPLPLIWDNLQKAAGHKWYNCLDCNWGFWNIPLAESSKEYTAFITNKGSFEFNVLPFGIKNSPGECQRAVDLIFGDLYNQGVLCYIDDIVIYTNQYDELLQLTEEVLIRCKKNGLYLKLSKSELVKNEVLLLGHTVGEMGIQPSPKKVEAIHKALPPKSKKDLRSFLGLASYVRRFVPNYSSIAFPLTSLIKEQAVFKWEEAQEKAFADLKKAVSEKVMLSAPEGHGVYVLVTDASEVALGAVLCQEQKGTLVVLEFASKTFTDAERKWSAREKEAFAIKYSVHRFEDYLKGGKFYVLTDHESLKWMENASSGKVQRWALYLQQFDAEIIHISGKANVMADWLSRSTEDEKNMDTQIEEIAVPLYMSQALPPIAYVPSEAKLRESYKSIPEDEQVHLIKGNDGLYYSARTNKLYIPPSLRQTVLYWFHTSELGGHCGANKTARRMRRWVWWPRMPMNVRDYVSKCILCTRTAAMPKAPSLSYVLERPFPMQLVSLDHVGPRDWKGNQFYYLVIIDHHSRFLQGCIACNVTSRETRRIFHNEWIGVFGVPDVVLTDRGPAFRAEDFRNYVTKELGAYHVFTSPYYPRGNGINEACHASLEACMKAFANANDNYSFEDALRYAVIVHNATPHVAVGRSPYEVLFGQEMCLPGWQPYFSEGRRESSRLKKLEVDLKAAMIEGVSTQNVELQGKETLEEGDIVVYYLSQYEKQNESRFVESKSYTLAWSTPQRVVEVKDKIVRLVPLGAGRSSPPRQVPVSLVKKLQTSIPESLVPLSLKQLEIRKPYRPNEISSFTEDKSVTWKELETQRSSGTKKRKFMDLSVKEDEVKTHPESS